MCHPRNFLGNKNIELNLLDEINKPPRLFFVRLHKKLNKEVDTASKT